MHAVLQGAEGDRNNTIHNNNDNDNDNSSNNSTTTNNTDTDHNNNMGAEGDRRTGRSLGRVLRQLPIAPSVRSRHV